MVVVGLKPSLYKWSQHARRRLGHGADGLGGRRVDAAKTTDLRERKLAQRRRGNGHRLVGIPVPAVFVLEE